MLALTSLVVGRYIFDLTVLDEEGLSSTDTATVVVKPGKSTIAMFEPLPGFVHILENLKNIVIL